ncbi:MAG: hypothetical protein KGL95_05360, partial [Patescibacteria group bacterium]|nr:hypothetical protein [Patescibacteria group bacterium]
ISTSILFLIKFDIAIASFGLLTFFCLYLAIQKRKTEFIVSISSFVISIAIIWLILGGSPTQFFAYVSNSLMISSTYDAAMSADQLAIITTPLIIISWAVLFLIIFTEKKYPKNFRLLFLSLVLLFISYKHGVVRNDLHVLDFFFGWAILLYIYRSSISKKIDFRGTKIITFCLVGILVSSAILVANSTGDLLISKITSSAKNVISAYSNSNIVSIPTYFEFIVNPSILEQTKINEKDSLRSYYNFSSQILNTVKNNRIDVIPQEIALLYAYDMNWSPRPTMQTQVDIVPRLDNVTSQYFTNVTSAPKFVLYQITTIDNRFPEFDEPLTLKAILCNYKTIGLSGNMWLLQLNNNQCTNPNLLTTEYVSFNQTVSVPQSKSDLLFAKIYINYNLLGEISKLLYKPPQIHFIDKQQNYRFVQSTASDGILLSYSNKIQSAFPMLNYNFSSFRIDTDQKYYENKIKIEFFGMNGSFPKSIVPFSNIVSNPIDMLLKIYANRPDLQAVAPEVKSGDLKGLLNWARTEGPNEYAELGPLKPLFDLLQVYYSRPDLQKAFPEVIQEHKIHNLIQWAAQYGIHEEPTLKTDERYFVRYLS